MMQSAGSLLSCAGLPDCVGLSAVAHAACCKQSHIVARVKNSKCFLLLYMQEAYLVMASCQGLPPQHRQPALQHKPVHPLPAAVCCQEVHVACAEPRLPCSLKGYTCRSEFEALSTSMGHPGDVWLQFQHKGPVIAGYLAHAWLTALLHKFGSTMQAGCHQCAEVVAAISCCCACRDAGVTGQHRGSQPGVRTCRMASSSCLLSTEASSTSPPGQRQMKWGMLLLWLLLRL